MQLDLFTNPELTGAEISSMLADIKRHYWYIRNLRGGWFSQAEVRRRYRQIARQKKRLLAAGVQKDALLAFLRYCRSGRMVGVTFDGSDSSDEDSSGDLAQQAPLAS